MKFLRLDSSATRFQFLTLSGDEQFWEGIHGRSLLFSERSCKRAIKCKEIMGKKNKTKQKTLGNIKFGLVHCCWVCSEGTSCPWTTSSTLMGRKLGETHLLSTAHMLNYWKEGKVCNSSLPAPPNIPVLLYLPGKSHCSAFHRCAELLSPAAFLKIKFKRFALVLTPENDDHLSKTLIRKHEKSVFNANHDMYSAASQACFISDRYGQLMQSHRGPEDLWRAVPGIVFN